MRRESSLRTLHVGIVDDHPLVRDGIVARLQRVDDILVAWEAESGEAALRCLWADEPDVLILDIQLPDISGLDVARAVHMHHSDVAILLITGYDIADYSASMLDVGAAACPPKTIQATALIEAVHTAASQHREARSWEPSQGSPQVAQLTPRENEVLQLLRQGLRNSEIADHLVVAPGTVEYHVRNILHKLGARSRTEAIIKAQLVETDGSGLMG